MSGRVKFVDKNGDPTNVSNSPPLGYEYDIPSDYDKSCGTFGLEDFQLPNSQCPKEFVCDQPEGSTGKFASCLDSMNCAMVVGMTTNVNKNDAVALFNHQMIPHHQNAVNMCKALEKSGAVACDDLSNVEDPKCLTAALCFEIINGQNFQIQTMRGILELLGADEEDDCVVPIHDFKKASKKKKKHKS
jgi:hypothetical protein